MKDHNRTDYSCGKNYEHE